MRSWPTSLRHCRGRPKPLAHSIDSQTCGPLVGDEAVQEALRARTRSRWPRSATSPSGERRTPPPSTHEEEIVAVAVGEVDRIGLVGVDDRDDDVVVEQQRHARVERRAAPAGQLLRAVVAARQRARLVVGRAPGAPSRAPRSRAPPCAARSSVVQDGERPLEAVAGEALLVAQPPAVVAQRRVRLVRDRAGRHSIEHRVLRFTCAARAARAAARPPAGLLALDRLEQRAEVAGAEALVPLALDDLEEERPRLRIVVEAGRLLEEDLQQVLVRLRAVDEDLELAQGREALVDRARRRCARAAPAARRSSCPAWA